RWKADTKYHIDDFIGERGKTWLKEKRPADKPWFLWLSFPGPHQPYDCSDTSYASRYNLADIDLPQTNESHLKDKPPHFMAQIETGSGNPGVMPVSGITEEEIRITRRSYYANMS